MRIIRSPNPTTPAPAPIPTPTPAPTPERAPLDPLLDKLQEIEDRLHALEQPQKPEKSRPSLAKVTWDADAVKKALLTKMWKYLHDDRSPKTI